MKQIIDHNGMGRQVETDGEVWYFRAGDVIYHDRMDSLWFNKRVVVEGFETSRLWGTIIGENHSQCADLAENLILLERPGLKFKVGDRVIFDHDPGLIGEVIVISPEADVFPYFVRYENVLNGHEGMTAWDCAWYPEKYKIADAKNFLWRREEHLELAGSMADPTVSSSSNIIPGETGSESNENPNQTESGVMAMPERMPEWVQEMLDWHKAGITLFILHGNIDDVQIALDGQAYCLVNYLLEKIFSGRKMTMTYSISSGLKFDSSEMENDFRQKYLPSDRSGGQGDPNSAVARASQQMHQQMAGAPLDELIGKSPERLLPLLERALADKDPENKKALIIDFVYNIAPAGSGNLQMADRVNIETIQRWAQDEDIQANGNIIILLVPQLSLLSERLRAGDSMPMAKIIRLPKPDEDQRVAYWHRQLNGNQLADGLNEEGLGRITNGLSLRQIGQICSVARQRKQVISLELIRQEKQSILEAEFGGRLTIKLPQWGFDLFGGKNELKDYFSEIKANILGGVLRRVPMGILAVGPPGTGKTFFFECWARECGFTVVEIANPREKWVGTSEENMAGILAALDDLSPVIVIEDEADQSEASRDAPNGDSGVSNRLRQMKFKFCSDPKRRGRVIWVRITNRDDLLDEAYKRKGRSDDSIPFLLPDAEELPDIFRVMFSRYNIPTEISDFKPFVQMVLEKEYCTGADVEWMVLEADKMAGREGLDAVCEEHPMQAIDDWEMGLDPAEVNRQIITAIEGSSKRLRPQNWQEILSQANEHLGMKGSAIRLN